MRIGISGWTYPPWRGVFYPEKLAHKRELNYAANIFRSIEINGTFYSLQRPTSYAKWSGETPDDFVFSVKAPRYVTHMRRLKEIRAPLANFFASGLLKLGPKLGPILWQFPPSFKFVPDLFATFLELLPHDSIAAAELAKDHDTWLDGRSFIEVDAKRPVRHAVEIRNQSFVVPEFIALLRKHRVALVCADAVEWPRLMDVTADFMYCRLHGSKELYASGYGPKALDAWAVRVAAWAEGSEPVDATRASSMPATKRAKRDVFVYFDNDAKVRAPKDAKGLTKRVDGLIGSREETR